ncbi:MAG: type II toxin-antitoxin system PemK/MazF family toxin [Coriobacteriales bacterium]|jgi:mRNA interferase MazF|nr:type II toxin-antitoxin system PemK/MazF family toxin [Coriobacteriales bacterium]
MKLGDIYLLQGPGYGSKPRPVVIIQSDRYVYDSEVVCLLTSFNRSEDELSVAIQPSPLNGLEKPSWAICDKTIAFQKEYFDKKIGVLTSEEMHQIRKRLIRLFEITEEDFSPE